MGDKKHPVRHNLVFEDYYSILEHEISKRRARWKLDDSVLWFTWDDAKIHIITHLYKKWYQYNPNKGSVANWANRIISNQIWNLVRDHYGAAKNPCISCEFNEGGEKCMAFGTQKCLECPLYLKWYKGKRFKLEIAFASSVDATIPGEDNNIKRELVSKECTFLDFEKLIPEFHNLMKDKLKPIEWQAYTCLFIDHRTDLQTARELNYSTEGGKDSKGVKAVAKIKTKIYSRAKEVVNMIEFN